MKAEKEAWMNENISSQKKHPKACLLPHIPESWQLKTSRLRSSCSQKTWSSSWSSLTDSIERWKDLFILWYHFNVEGHITFSYYAVSDRHHADEGCHHWSSWSWHHPRVSPAPVPCSAVHVISVGSSLLIRIPIKNINTK